MKRRDKNDLSKPVRYTHEWLMEQVQRLEAERAAAWRRAAGCFRAAERSTSVVSTENGEGQ